MDTLSIGVIKMKTLKNKMKNLGKTFTIMIDAFESGSVRISLFQAKRKNHNYDCRILGDYEAMNF